MAYEKPWLSFEEQLEKLQERGLIVEDTHKALSYLERIGYYRLSGYWYAFRERGDGQGLGASQGGLNTKRSRPVLDTFKLGSTFKNAVDLYVFDKKLRLLILDALERIEISLRVDLSHLLGEAGPDTYLNPDNFSDKFAKKLNSHFGSTDHQRWLAKHDELIRRSKEEFIKHNKEKYGLPVAVWVACEVWDFGCLSNLYSGLKPDDQRKIAEKYGIKKGKVFVSWLRSLNYLRNVCAHHSRLWNRNMSVQPSLPNDGTIAWISGFKDDRHSQARPFLHLCIARHLLSVINPESSWCHRLYQLLDEFPDLEHLGLSLQGMGVIPELLEEFQQA